MPTVPNTLVAGTEIEAAPLNENFTALLTAIKAIEERVASAYSAAVSRAAKTAFTPSSTRSTHVILQVTGASGKGAAITVKVGGVAVTGFNVTSEGVMQLVGTPVSFVCAAGEAWEWEGSSITGVTSSYKTLPI